MIYENSVTTDHRTLDLLHLDGVRLDELMDLDGVWIYYAWKNSVQVDTRTQHFPCPSKWTKEPQVWCPRGSPNLAHLHACPPSCWVREPRISHTCTNSISTDMGAQNFPHLDDHAHPDEHGNPRSGVQVEGESILLGHGTLNLPHLH